MCQEWLIECNFWRSDIYAIVETGGKQYRVTPGQVIEVDFLDAIDGTTVELDRVLFIGDGSTIITGKPTIEGAKVLATSQGDVKSEKTIALKFKNKTRYSRKIGHREKYSKIAIDKIIVPEGLETGQD